MTPDSGSDAGTGNVSWVYGLQTPITKVDKKGSRHWLWCVEDFLWPSEKHARMSHSPEDVSEAQTGAHTHVRLTPGHQGPRGRDGRSGGCVDRPLLGENRKHNRIGKEKAKAGTRSFSWGGWGRAIRDEGSRVLQHLRCTSNGPGLCSG